MGDAPVVTDVNEVENKTTDTAIIKSDEIDKSQEEANVTTRGSEDAKNISVIKSEDMGKVIEKSAEKVQDLPEPDREKEEMEAEEEESKPITMSPEPKVKEKTGKETN